MAGWRLTLLVLALIAPALAWGEAPLTSPLPRPRPGAASVPPLRPAGAMTITEAAEAQAIRDRQAAEAARQAAESVATSRIEVERVVAERIAESEAQATETAEADSPLAVARSLFPRHRSTSVVRRYAALAAERARTRAEPPAATAAARPARTGGPSGRGLCGVPGLGGRELPRITSSTQGCGVAEPVSVTSVDGIPLTLAATLDCTMATAFERWVRTELVPAVGRTGGGVAQIRVIGHYSCRTRNNQRGARVSEHGRGMAIDVAGFRLANGTQVSVEGDYRRGRYSRLLHGMYQAGCGIFPTTLSPDSDRFHQDHFHFDMAQYRGSGTYCR